MQNDIICPLTGDTNLELVETIAIKDIIEIYRKYRNLDLTGEFGYTEIFL